jgi:hypothetical protein
VSATGNAPSFWMLLQAATGNERHGQVRPLSVLAGVEEGNQTSSRWDSSRRSTFRATTAPSGSREGPEHDPHAALAENLLEPVRPDPIAGPEVVVRGSTEHVGPG